jgi:hypothetical protein
MFFVRWPRFVSVRLSDFGHLYMPPRHAIIKLSLRRHRNIAPNTITYKITTVHKTFSNSVKYTSPSIHDNTRGKKELRRINDLLISYFALQRCILETGPFQELVHHFVLPMLDSPLSTLPEDNKIWSRQQCWDSPWLGP